jgi:Glycosyl hydrolase family 79, N-terminal domain.
MNKAAKITVQYDRVGNNKINPYIFGNFVEDIRDHMDAMLAYVLKDMDFEEEDHNSDGVSGCWYPITNGKNTVFELEPAAPLHSGHSQRIRLISADNCYGGIAQRISVKGNMEYKIRIYARATAEISQIKLEVVDVHKIECLGSTVISIDSHQWKEYVTSIFITRECSDAEFKITISVNNQEWPEHMTKGNLWIDHVSMLPADSVGNVKREVLNMARDLNCGMMRLGGNEISCYHWQEGVGPEYLRPNRKSEAWGHWTNKYFGTDEFIRFCKDLSVEPLICVNAGSGTPEEAAQWVEYCNGSIDTPMGKLRAQNGHPEPYNVKYWEIGNEIYGPWQTGHCTAEEFGKRIIEFHKAMKQADQGIILLGCGHIDPEWSRTVLDIAGEYIDYLTLHIYHSYRNLGIDDNAPRQDRFKGIVCYPEVTRACLNAIKEIIESNSKYAHVKLAITEYNTMYFPSTIRQGMPNEHTLEAAVANAANLNEFFKKQRYY